MTLLRDIQDLIRLEGPITVERYMALALGHPRYGYYMARDPLGAAGDFTTSPEISQMFGELIGLWAAQTWLDMGRPDRIMLVECGPGRGTLMADALRAAKAVPAFRAALQVHMIETSLVLRLAQERTLAGIERPVVWHNSLAELPGDLPLIVIANEFLDALPIRQFIRRPSGWHERLIGLDGERLVFGLAAEPTSLGRSGPDGAVLEVAGQALIVVEALTRRLMAQGGTALLIDYGHVESGFGDTLQAVRHHAFVNPLEAPGDNDLTAHVDFAAVAAVARQGQAHVEGPMPQGDFLRSLGIMARAEMLKSHASGPPQRDAIDSQTARLTDMSSTGMGKLFKVLAIRDRPPS